MPRPSELKNLATSWLSCFQLNHNCPYAQRSVAFPSILGVAFWALAFKDIDYMDRLAFDVLFKKMLESCAFKKSVMKEHCILS